MRGRDAASTCLRRIHSLPHHYQEQTPCSSSLSFWHIHSLPHRDQQQAVSLPSLSLPASLLQGHNQSNHSLPQASPPLAHQDPPNPHDCLVGVGSRVAQRQ